MEPASPEREAEPAGPVHLSHLVTAPRTVPGILASGRLLLLGVGLAGCAVLIVARGLYLHDMKFRFLVWNLFLALIPAFAAAMSARAAAARRPLLPWLWGALWILFLPNAPYLITDLVHLQPRPPVPYWFDILLFATFAGAGLLAAFSSFRDIQHVVTRRFGRLAGWGVLALAAFASGFGIYLGRDQRLNSWDVFTRPHDVVPAVTGRLLEPWTQPRALAVTLLYGAVILYGYIAVRLIMRPRED